MTAVVQEVACPPDQLEVDAVAALVFTQDGGCDGPAGFLDRRLGYHLGSRTSASQCLLIRSNHKLAAGWALFFPGGQVAPADNPAVCRLLEGLLLACYQAGFGRIALAAPAEAATERNLWVRALADAAARVGPESPDCLLTFDQSYLHDHSGPVF